MPVSSTTSDRAAIWHRRVDGRAAAAPNEIEAEINGLRAGNGTFGIAFRPNEWWEPKSRQKTPKIPYRRSSSGCCAPWPERSLEPFARPVVFRQRTSVNTTRYVMTHRNDVSEHVFAWRHAGVSSPKQPQHHKDRLKCTSLPRTTGPES